MIENDLRQFILDNTEINGKINGNVGYGKVSQELDYPYINFFRISNALPYVNIYRRPRFQFSVWSDFLGQARDIADLLENALHRYNGMIGESKIITTYVEGDEELYDSEADAWHIPVSVMIVYKTI